MKTTYEGWDSDDKQPVRGTLQGLDRAQTQAADLITVHLAHSPLNITIKQNPTALKGSKVKVGAAVWDGAYVLAAYLDAQPADTFKGLCCVELGCGCGLLGLVLARLGAAAVYLTDKPQHIVAPRVNAARNKLLAPAVHQQPATAGRAAAGPTPGCSQLPAGQGMGQLQQQQQQQSGQPLGGPVSSNSSSSSAPVQVLALDWEDDSSIQAAAAAIKAQGGVDLIVASDCIYPDPDGSCPSSSGFMAAVAALITPGHTRVYTTFEARSDDLRAALLAAAAAVPGGCEVVRVGQDELPEGFQAPHVELYELKL